MTHFEGCVLDTEDIGLGRGTGLRAVLVLNLKHRRSVHKQLLSYVCVCDYRSHLVNELVYIAFLRKYKP